MRLSTRIFGLGLLAMAFLCAAGSAEAASFADYVYQNAKTGNIAGIKNYLRRGYSIDAVSPMAIRRYVLPLIIMITGLTAGYVI
ncbi:MAG: hypothetical protein V8R11_06695 [Alphaproteobacteria bacterium]